MKEGKIREAVRRSSSKSELTLLDPWSTITTPDSESKKVIDVLREKHPAPAPVYKEAVKEVLEYEELPQPKVIDITAADIERQASFLSGSGGPSRIDASCLKRLLLTHGEPSKDLREQLARRANMIAKEQVEWARIEASQACRGIGLGKTVTIDGDSMTATKTRPVDIPETISRLLTKCICDKVRSEYVDACGVKQLCTGVRAGLEASVHAMRVVYEEGNQLNTAEEPEVIMALDAKDAFNRQSRITTLLRNRIKCPSSSVYTCNTHRSPALIFIHDRNGKKCEVIKQREGFSQGGPQAMNLFAINTLELLEDTDDMAEQDQLIVTGYADEGSDAQIGIGLGFQGAALEREDFLQSHEEARSTTPSHQIPPLPDTPLPPSSPPPKSRQIRKVAYADDFYITGPISKVLEKAERLTIKG